MVDINDLDPKLCQEMCRAFLTAVEDSAELEGFSSIEGFTGELKFIALVAAGETNMTMMKQLIKTILPGLKSDPSRN